MRTEAVLELPGAATLQSVTHFRSTWLLSSLQTLRARGHYDGYLAHLGAEHREAVLFCSGNVWLPMDVARAHYLACEALELTRQEQLEMGLNVSVRAQRTAFATAVTMARTAGVTPWTVMPQFDRLWALGFKGGAVGVTKTGPKEAQATFVANELFSIRYFRNGFRGILLDLTSMFCHRAYVHDVTPAIGAPGDAIFRFQWA